MIFYTQWTVVASITHCYILRVLNELRPARVRFYLSLLAVDYKGSTEVLVAHVTEIAMHSFMCIMYISI